MMLTTESICSPPAGGGVASVSDGGVVGATSTRDKGGDHGMGGIGGGMGGMGMGM